LIKNYLN